MYKLPRYQTIQSLLPRKWKGLKKEFLTGCNPAWINNPKAIDNIEEYMRRLRDDFSSFLRGWVNAWTGINNEKYLLAIQVPNESNRSSIELVLHANTVLKSISLPYEEEKCKDLAIPSITASEDHSGCPSRSTQANGS